MRTHLNMLYDIPATHATRSLWAVGCWDSGVPPQSVPASPPLRTHSWSQSQRPTTIYLLQHSARSAQLPQPRVSGCYLPCRLRLSPVAFFSHFERLDCMRFGSGRNPAYRPLKTTASAGLACVSPEGACSGLWALGHDGREIVRPARDF